MNDLISRREVTMILDKYRVPDSVYHDINKLPQFSADREKGEYIRKADMERILYSTSNAVRIGEEFLELPTYSFPDREKGEWIPIKDQLPKDGEEVLVSLTPNGVHGKKVELDCFMMSDIKYWQSGKVEAWQPKPEPYKGGENKT